MEFKSKIELQQLKNMAISHLLYCQLKEQETPRLTGLKTLVIQSVEHETEILLRAITNELKSIES